MCIVLVLFSDVFGCCVNARLRHLCCSSEGRGVGLVFSVVVGLTMLLFFGCCKFLLGAVKKVVNVRVPRPRLSLPVKLSFCAFHGLSCLFSVCLDGIDTRQGFLAFSMCDAVFPCASTKPVMQCASVRARLGRHAVGVFGFNVNTRLFIGNLTGGILLTSGLSILCDDVYNRPRVSMFAS